MGKAPPAGGQLEEGALRRPTGREAVWIGVGAVGGGCLRGLHLGGWRVVEGVVDAVVVGGAVGGAASGRYTATLLCATL